MCKNIILQFLSKGWKLRGIEKRITLIEIEITSGRKSRDTAKVQMEKPDRTRFQLVIIGSALILFLLILFSAVLSKYPFDPLRKYLQASSRTSNQPMAEKIYSVVPEYEQTMAKVVISLAPADKELKHHQELLNNLPPYTEVVLLLPENNRADIESEYKKAYHNKLITVPYKSHSTRGASYYAIFPENDKLVEFDTSASQISNGQGSAWARDLFVSVRQSNDLPLLIVPDIHKYFISYGDKSDLKVINDNYYLTSLASDKVELAKVPLTFQGGNIQFDIYDHRKIAFVGSNTLLSTKTVWRSTMDSEPSDDQIIAMVKNYFRVDEVVVIGKNQIQPPSLMFHLDQTMVILNRGVVGLTHIVGQQEYAELYSKEVKAVELFLESARKALIEKGYRIFNIDTSVKNIVNHQHYVNAIPYLDRRNGKKVLLMPVFKDSQTEFDKHLIKKNTETFISLDFDVIEIPTEAGKLNGGIHCLINVLI